MSARSSMTISYETFRTQRLEQLKADYRVPGGDSTEAPGMNNIAGLIDLVRFAKPHSVVEIGSHRGVSTEVFLLHCRKVVAVDPWERTADAAWELFFFEFLSRVSEYPNLQIIRGASPDALAPLADNEFDLCYIDGAHDEASVLRDIEACKRLVRPGGWYAGHDWLPGNDVDHAVRKSFGEPKVFADTSWLIKK